MKNPQVQNVFLDYNSISLKLDALSTKIKEQNFDGIVIIMRGGSFPGIHLAFLTGLHYYLLEYDRPNSAVRWMDKFPKKGKMLLVEDFAGMGKTLIDCKQFLLDFDYQVSTLVVCKDLKSATVPDYYCFNCNRADARFILPWERYSVNKFTVETSTGQRMADYDYERTLYDLGLVNAVSNSIEEKDGFITVSKGSSMLGYKILAENPIIFGDSEIEKSLNLTKLALWKGLKSIQYGYTHLTLESCEEAVFVAEKFPELRVCWWNKGMPINIQAAKHSVENANEIYS
ncbi:hypothetical protein ER45_029685 (plasmid) [Bacillus mycoides]|nr:hypothetical protein ER45_029685 [Bacillus mycoides]